MSGATAAIIVTICVFVGVVIYVSVEGTAARKQRKKDEAALRASSNRTAMEIHIDRMRDIRKRTLMLLPIAYLPAVFWLIHWIKG